MVRSSQLSNFHSPVCVAALYRFCEIDDPSEWKEWIHGRGEAVGLCGTILVAPEGINGTVAGTGEAVRSFLSQLESCEGLENLQIRYSECQERPFQRWRVRLKSEIVSLGVDEADPLDEVGKYLEPTEWNALLKEEGVTVIDTRNHYETRIGGFEGAVDPGTETFREFPSWVEKNLDPRTTPRVAMYCTGGIRCEKATSLLLHKGFREVYHLKGGILRYLEEIPKSESLWNGECFVFDERVSVDHELKPGSHVICDHCQLPIPAEDMDSHQCETMKRSKMKPS